MKQHRATRAIRRVIFIVSGALLIAAMLMAGLMRGRRSNETQATGSAATVRSGETKSESGGKTKADNAQAMPASAASSATASVVVRAPAGSGSPQTSLLASPSGGVTQAAGTASVIASGAPPTSPPVGPHRPGAAVSSRPPQSGGAAGGMMKVQSVPPGSATVTGGGAATVRPLVLPTVEQIRDQPASVTAAQVLSQKLDANDPATREAVGRALKMSAELRKKAAWEKAAKLGLPTSGDTPGGGRFELQDFDTDGKPLYHATQNVNAAITTATHQVRAVFPGFFVDGADMMIGMWEAGGTPRYYHEEFDPLGGGSGSTKIIQQDVSSAPMGQHATHVAATLVGTGGTFVGGVIGKLRGMASGASLDAYDSTGDSGEMFLAGAVSGDAQTNAFLRRLYVSNHSYGPNLGWAAPSGGTYSWIGTYTPDANNGDDVDGRFGLYRESATAIDGVVMNCPYYLPFFSAGNERNDAAPPDGSSWSYWNSASQSYILVPSYVAGRDPLGDGAYKSGYDTIPEGGALAKNVMTVGAVTPAVLGGARDISKAAMTAFSSWGPTDDGRIKPDIVADGYQVLSASHEADNASAVLSGTSMAGPNASGSALLLQQLHISMFAEPMSASMLKALIIHTADDIGTPGPDYQTGWGLMNTRKAADILNAHRQRTNSVAMFKGKATSGSMDEYPLTLDGTSPLRVTLCWTDPPGAEDTTHDDHTPDLVNNLQLEVRGPGSTVYYYPYRMPYVGSWTQASLSLPAEAGVNDVDNVEQVLIPAPVAGVYTVVVYNASLKDDEPQDYSLIMTGDLPPPEIVVDDIYGYSLTDGASAFSFGALAPGEAAPPPITVTIRNNGEGQLFDLVVKRSGPQKESFTFTQPAVTTLNTGESTTFTVSFTGTAGGSHAANIHILSNDPDEFPFDFQVAAFRDEDTKLKQDWSTMNNLVSRIALDAQGNTIGAGTRAEPVQTFRNDPYVIKYASDNGAILWEQPITNARGVDDDERLMDMKVDGAGDVLVQSMARITVDAGHWRPRFFTTKLSGANGLMAWSKFVDSSVTLTNSQSHLSGLLYVDPAHNVFVLCDSLYQTTRYAPDGTVMWHQNLGIANGGSILSHSNLVDKDGHFVQAARSEINGKWSAADGTKLWDLPPSFPNTGPNAMLGGALFLGTDPGGNIAVVGEGGVGTHAGADSVHVAKLAPDGTKAWSVLFNEIAVTPSLYHGTETPTGVAADAGGNVFAFGHQIRVPQGRRGFLAKHDSTDGHQLWLKHFETGLGAYYSDVPSTSNPGEKFSLLTGEWPQEIKLDRSGNPIVTIGIEYGVNTYWHSSSWSYSVLRKYSSADGSLIWERGGWRWPGPLGLDVNSAGKIACLRYGDGTEIIHYSENINDPPALTIAQVAITVDEGQTAINAGTLIDPDAGDTITLTATHYDDFDGGFVPIGTITRNVSAGTWQWSFDATAGPQRSTIVTVMASDGVNAVVKKTFEVVVNNVLPSFTAGSDVSLNPAQALAFERTISFTDPGDDLWSATVNYGAGNEFRTVNPSTKSFTLSHAFLSPGVYPVSVTVNDGEGGGSVTHTFKVTVQRLITDWRMTHFGTTDNTGDAADTADADGDGIPNLAEFAFNLDPKKGDPSGLPGLSFASGGNLLGESDDSGALDPKAISNLGSGDNMVITFAEPPGTTGITYGAESSGNLTSWSPITDTGTGGTHTFSVSVSTNTKLFMRLKVMTVP